MLDYCNWDCLNKAATIVTLVGIPSLIILYFTIFKGVIKLVNINRKNYISKRLKGKIVFNYSNNNGLYTLGADDLVFDVKFSKSSKNNIIIYNDPQNIKYVSLVKDTNNIYDIVDAAVYDTSSRTRRPNLDEIVILQNKYDNFCAIKILNIKDDTRGDEHDEVIFDYVINPDGYKDFSN